MKINISNIISHCNARRLLPIQIITLLCFSAINCTSSDETLLKVSVQGEERIGYQAKPIPEPKGGEPFRGSHFIHPLKTPSGFVVTEIQPPDHFHHFGLWWPWKYLEVEGRMINCWELQEGDGLVQARQSYLTPEGFAATCVYIDRKAPEGEEILLKETLNASVSRIIDGPVKGYNLDLEIVQKVNINKPVTVTKYRYSGFSFRGTSKWNKNNSTVVTNEGKDYNTSNFTRAKWVKVEGHAEKGQTAGVLLMSCPKNHDHPELLRTWDKSTHDGAIFINFNSVQNESWTFEQGGKYIRRFRVFVYDGILSPEQAEAMWKLYNQEISSFMSYHSQEQLLYENCF